MTQREGLVEGEGAESKLLKVIMMSVKILSKEGDRISILFKDIPTEVLSSIRRAAIEEVPTMAIDDVIIVKNNSVIHDEVLAHRLGMIPLRSKEALEKYNPPEMCAECVDCENCFAKLYIMETVNTKEDKLVIYSGDIKSVDQDVVPVIKDIPIVVLGKGHSIEIEMNARLGRGKEHIKWSPVSVSVLLSVPQLVFDLSKCSENESSMCLSCIREYDEGLAEEISNKKKGEIKLYDFSNTSLLKYCESKHCSRCVKVNYLENERILKLESTGALPVEDIFRQAIKELVRKLDNLEKIFASIEGGQK